MSTADNWTRRVQLEGAASNIPISGISTGQQRRQSLGILLSNYHGSELWPSTPAPLTTEARLMTAIIGNSYQAAFTHFTIAIILNHIRTVFLPWLGIDTWRHPMEQLRLARSNPDIFVDSFHSYSWTWMAFSVAQRQVCDISGGLLLKAIVNDRYQQNGPVQMYIVAYLVWIFTHTEYLFSRSVNFWAVMTAYRRLASEDSEVHQTALNMAVRKHWLKMAITGCQMLYFARFTIIPLVSDAARCVPEGQLGLPLFLGVIASIVWAVIVHRSFFFIALEVSQMFVAVGWFLVGTCILGGWYVADIYGGTITTPLEYGGQGVLKAVLSEANS